MARLNCCVETPLEIYYWDYLKTVLKKDRMSSCHCECAVHESAENKRAVRCSSAVPVKKKIYDEKEGAQRGEPCKRLATDASPSGDGGYVAPITHEAWLALHELTEEKESTCALTGMAMNN